VRHRRGGFPRLQPRSGQDLQDRAVLSLDLVSLPLGDAVSRQDKNLVSRLLSGLATNDDPGNKRRFCLRDDYGS
jgi:hypothetical protein